LSARYRSAPQSKGVKSTAAPEACTALMASGMTSLPIPSPGITAICFFCFTRDSDRNQNREEDTRQSSEAHPKIRFNAEQQWRIQVVAADAQKVIDIAVAAGANSVQGVEWNVSDPQQLRAKAYAAALTRAKEMAEQAAAQANVKLGELVSIINGDDSESLAKLPMRKKMQAIMVEAAPTPNLVLYPSKVEREATVTVIYAIGQ